MVTSYSYRVIRTPTVDTLKFKLTIAYDGTAYQGWQVQKTGTGVQEKVEAALAKLFPSVNRAFTVPAARTRAFTRSAWWRISKFRAPNAKCRCAKLALALNAWLPEDIRVLSAARAPAKFHARFDATGKQYRYFVWNHPAMNPLLRHTAWHVPRPLDLAGDAGGGTVVSWASTISNRSPARATTRWNPPCARLTRCDLKKKRAAADVLHRGRRVSLQNVSRHRGHAGSGRAGKNRGDRTSNRFWRSRDRRVAGMTAPAHGLVLWKVFYRKG